ncbi:MAG: hypothetical protein CM1200mP40_00150 [Gammaproteobacteria bacterium]|nr:MAG: hypothetical protein CM1200mP40_00150 [Gammaproteobacteria bacterium]
MIRLLIEAYGDMGHFYSEIEDYENAIRLYTEALQISRINTGLYSPEQIPILDSLIEANSRNTDWQEVDDFQELHYLINSRIYELTEIEYIAAAETYGAWKLRVIRENLLDQSRFSLLNTAENLSDFYARTIERLELIPDVRQEDLITVIYGKSQTDLTLAQVVASTPYTAFEGTESQSIVRYVALMCALFQARCRGSVIQFRWRTHVIDFPSVMLSGSHCSATPGIFRAQLKDWRGLKTPVPSSLQAKGRKSITK